MIEYCNINKLKLAMVLMRFHIIRTFIIGDDVRMVWPWQREDSGGE